MGHGTPSLAELKARKLAAQQAQEPQEEKGPSLWDRIGRLPGALATGVRIGSGVLASPGGAWGATIGAAGEGAAQLIEKPKALYDAVAGIPDVVRNSFSNDENVRKATSQGFKEGVKTPIARMTVEGAFGAVPGAKLFKGGRFLESAARSGAMSGTGSIGRNIANDEDIDLGAAATNTGLGALLGGALGKIAGPSKAFRNKQDYQERVKGPWMAKGLPEQGPPPPPPSSPFQGRTTDEANKIGQIWTDDLEKGYAAEKRDLKHQLGMFDKERAAWSKSEAEKLVEEAKQRTIKNRRLAEGAEANDPMFSDVVTAKAPDGSTSTMRTSYTTEAQREAAETARASKKKNPNGPTVPDDDSRGPFGSSPKSNPPSKDPFDAARPVGRGVAEDINQPRTLSGLLGVGDDIKAPPGVSNDVAEDISSGAIDVRPIPKAVPNVSDRRMDELLKKYGGRRSTDPPELRGKPRTNIDPPLDAEIGPAYPRESVVPIEAASALKNDVVENTPLGKLLQVFRSRKDATGAHYKDVKEAALTEPNLRKPIGINDSKGKPYTSERIAGKNARQDAQKAGVPPTNRPSDVVDNPPLTDPNDITARNIEQTLAARKGTGIVSVNETADEAQARVLREDLAKWDQLQPAQIPSNDPIRNLPSQGASKAKVPAVQPANTSFTPSELKQLKKLGVKDKDLDIASSEELRTLLDNADKLSNKPAPSVQGTVGGVVDQLSIDELAELVQRGVTDDQVMSSSLKEIRELLKTPSLNKPKLVKKSQKSSPLTVRDDDPSIPVDSKPKLIKGGKKQDFPIAEPNPIDPSGESGQVDLNLLMKLLAPMGGAAVGAAMDDENPLEGAVMGGLAGGAASFGPGIARSLKGKLPQGREELSEFIDNAGKEFPHYQRGNYLASAPGLLANAGVGPAASGFTSALEVALKGDPRGMKALKELSKLFLKPSHGINEVKKGFGEAAQLVETAERRTLGEAPGTFARAMAGPGTILTTGDVTVRNALIRAGFSVDEAKLMTMTNEPTSQVGKAAVNFQRTGGPWANTMLPFVRTPMNMLEQGAQRLPGVGGLYKLFKGAKNDNLTRQALRDIAAEQGVSIGTGALAYGAGANMDQDTARTARRFVSNAGGRNAFTANIGFALGQDSRRANPNTGNTLARSVASGFAFPQTDALQDQIKMGTSILSGETPEVPGGLYPKFFDEVSEFLNPPTTLTATPSNVPSLSNIRRRRGQ